LLDHNGIGQQHYIEVVALVPPTKQMVKTAGAFGSSLLPAFAEIGHWLGSRLDDPTFHEAEHRNKIETKASWGSRNGPSTH
jgi:hypothetical protein